MHRLRALVLLGRFLDMGSWAVDLALSVGIFPYVLKLLQTTASDLRTTLILIWTKILALDKSCQVQPGIFFPSAAQGGNCIIFGVCWSKCTLCFSRMQIAVKLKSSCRF